jgi:hypothetical protein
MESLAYTVVCLLRGSLPWFGCNKVTTVEMKEAVSGKTLCEELPDVFARFFDYTRDPRCQDEPRHAHWRDEFKKAYDDQFDPPADGAFGLNEQQSAVSQMDWPTPREDQLTTYSSDGREASHNNRSDHGFYPRYTWPAPQGVNDQDLLGDEGLLSGVDVITTPPVGYTDLYPGAGETMAVRPDLLPVLLPK